MSADRASSGWAPPVDDRHVVGIGDLGVLQGAGRLITYGLGSCVGVCLYHPSSHTGALCHYLLPSPRDGGDDPANDPRMFGSRCLAMTLDELRSRGISPGHCHVAVVGGAIAFGTQDLFATGERNIAIARTLLSKAFVRISVEEVGGYLPRTLSLDVGNGTLIIRSPRTEDRCFDWKI